MQCDVGQEDKVFYVHTNEEFDIYKEVDKIMKGFIDSKLRCNDALRVLEACKMAVHQSLVSF